MILDTNKPDEAKAILRRVADEIMSGKTWDAAMATVGGKQATAFSWLDRARAAERANDTSSVFFLDWPLGTPPSYWNRVAFKARARRSLVLESAAVASAIFGTEEVVILDGRICWAEEDDFIGKDDDYVMLATGCEPSEVAWHRIKRAPDGKPVPLTRTVRPSAALTNKLLEGLLPEVYGQKLQVDSRSESVAKVIGPSFERDANAVKQLPAPLETDSELVRDLKAKLAAGIKHRYPQDAQGRRIPANTGKVRVESPPDNPKIDRERALQDHPRAYHVEAPAPPTPDYSRPGPQPQQADSAGYGRGTVLPGGVKVR